MINLDKFLDKINLECQKAGFYENIRLIAVSKNVTQKEVQELFLQGQREFGENRVQEMIKKQDELTKFNEIKWHMIGRLQKNKINHMIKAKPALWQSCEGLETALEVDKRLDAPLDCLLQINSAQEDVKQGVSPEKAIETYLQIRSKCQFLSLVGVMSIGAHSEDKKEIQKSFELTYRIFDSLKQHGAKICSMGMSDDYEMAISCGSNMIRVGRLLYI